LVWFRRDLRLEDNPAWAAASRDHDRVVALFVVDPRLWEGAGPHRRDQMAAHLAALDADLADRDGRLRVVRGDPAEVVPTVGWKLDAVYWNDDYTPYAVDRDREVARLVGGEVHRFHGSVVHRPGSICTEAGGPYQVFTPFNRKWESTPWEEWPAPGTAQVAADPGDGVPVPEGEPLMEGGAAAALTRLDAWLDGVDRYHEVRDRPDLDATSRLSADLKFGTLSPRRVAADVGDATTGRRAFVRQLAWRDFYAQVLFHHPRTVHRALRPEFDAIEWSDDDEAFAAWAEGRTGYPIVDAGMRQLIAEGWMHNRVRMITASFLVKDLLIDWRRGERHFRRLLVDADLAQNVGNWQWVAGTGADAAPYFRIFNPVTQGRKFDPHGEYIRRWVPELSEMGNVHIHTPWEGGPLELAAAGVELGETYPRPLVDHATAREETLAAYERARSAAS
jgi:deoxyribodipyrimidine photo-lyase